MSFLKEEEVPEYFFHFLMMKLIHQMQTAMKTRLKSFLSFENQASVIRMVIPVLKCLKQQNTLNMKVDHILTINMKAFMIGVAVFYTSKTFSQFRLCIPVTNDLTPEDSELITFWQFYLKKH